MLPAPAAGGVAVKFDGHKAIVVASVTVSRVAPASTKIAAPPSWDVKPWVA